jgi:hypothetical protein
MGLSSSEPAFNVAMTKHGVGSNSPQSETARTPSLPLRPTGRQVELDGLRGLAALMVCLSHLIGVLPSDTSTRLFGRLFNSLSHRFLCGAAAVDFFFVLSGFVEVAGEAEPGRAKF